MERDARGPVTRREGPSARARTGAAGRAPAVLTALAVCLAAATTMGCSDPVAFLELRTPFDPPRFYVLLWADVSSCSDRRGALDRVRWYRIEAFPDGPDVYGRWNTPHDITLRSDARYDEEVVQHEMLHDLLGGDLDHQDPAWEACDLPTGVG